MRTWASAAGITSLGLQAILREGLGEEMEKMIGTARSTAAVPYHHSAGRAGITHSEERERNVPGRPDAYRSPSRLR